jgi:hypothetical protein
VSWCAARRLPDVTLTDAETFGALESVDELDRTGVLSFDDALKRAGTYDHLPEATTVQVVLGSADADALHWGRGTNLYYAIEWRGACIPRAGPTGPSGGATCTLGTWGTVIDAHTGAFVVSGG